MAVLTAKVAAGATSITVDSATGFPTEPQFLINVGAERVAVYNVSGTTFSVVPALALAHRKGARVGLVNRELMQAEGVRGELTGEVTVDDAGLQMFSTDNTEQLASGTGFAGGWDDRIESGGIYNARFAEGSTTDMAASDGGTEATTTSAYEAAVANSDLPGWAINASPGTLKCITDATLYGGTALESTGTSGGDINVIYQDIALFSGDPQQFEFHAYLNGTGVATLESRFSWRDADHAIIGSEYIFSSFGLTTSPLYRRIVSAASASANAKYLRIKLRFTHTTTPRAVRIGALRRLVSWPTFAGYVAAQGIILRSDITDTGWAANGASAVMAYGDIDYFKLINAFMRVLRAGATDHIIEGYVPTPTDVIAFHIERNGALAWHDPATGTADTSLSRTAAGVVGLTTSLEITPAAGGQALATSDGYILFDTIGGGVEPANPAGTRVKLYARVNGAGKTELRARFDTGAFVTIAVEP